MEGVDPQEEGEGAKGLDRRQVVQIRGSAAATEENAQKMERLRKSR